MLVDSHCHLSFPELAADTDGVLRRMAEAGVGAALNVCVHMEQADAVLALARSRPGLYASVGVHPDHTGGIEPDVATLVERAQDPKVVAIGETGLDYYRLTEPLEWQRERFRVHIRAARASGKPLIVHTRSAAGDTMRLLREEGAEQAGGVMHCFTESREVADQALALGFYISFSGILTFRNAAALREVAARVPADRLLVETDAPYLSPAPMRGKVNEPARVRLVADCLAALRGVDPGRLEIDTTDNFCRLFNVLL